MPCTQTPAVPGTAASRWGSEIAIDVTNMAIIHFIFNVINLCWTGSAGPAQNLLEQSVSPTSLILSYLTPLVLSMRGDEVLVPGCLPIIEGHHMQWPHAKHCLQVTNLDNQPPDAATAETQRQAPSSLQATLWL